MNDETVPTAKRKLRTSAPRAAKVLDPGIKAIREKMALEVAAYRSALASAKILDAFLTKRLPKLSPNDRAKLFDELSKSETPELMPKETESETVIRNIVAARQPE